MPDNRKFRMYDNYRPFGFAGPFVSLPSDDNLSANQGPTNGAATAFQYAPLESDADRFAASESLPSQTSQNYPCTLTGFGLLGGKNRCIYRCTGSNREPVVTIGSLPREFCPAWILDR
jgi:hypothetical protein